MTIRSGACGLSLSILMIVAVRAQVRDLPAATEAHGAFGFPDSGGGRLLVTAELPRPELLKTALCRGNGPVPVRFARRQVQSAGSNGRQTPDAFDVSSGSAFALETGKVDSDASCFLASDSLLAGSQSLNVTPAIGQGACLQRGRLAALRRRPVVHCWPIAEAAPGRQIALLEFARQGTDALASLVLVDGKQTVFADYPATYRGEVEDLWRVDDGGTLSPDGFEVICLLQAQNSYVLGVKWAAAEGSWLSLWTSSQNGRFTQVIADYWYRSPV